MRAISSTSSLIKSGLTATVLLLAASVSFAQTVNLTAAPTKTVLPDGQSVPMWGYSCGAVVTGSTTTCAASNPATNGGGTAAGNWSPVVITVPYNAAGTNLTINLTNSLSFTAGTGTNTVPTSLTIVGQLGGGLGGTPTRTLSPVHAPLGASWPAAGAPVTTACGTGNGADPGAAGTFCPPAQPARVQSFATEVAAGATTALCWGPTCPAPTPALKPGTYLIESGTHPSIQGAMGLYGVLVVTDTTNKCAYYLPAVGTAAPVCGVGYDADVPLLLSEIDPVQNGAVAAAVATAGFSETRVWSGQPGNCGDPAATGVFNTCYPPVVNYSPRYYLVNGASFDRTNLAASTVQSATTAGSTATTGKILLRFVNAGLRMHVPSVVGANMTLFAEDGNLLPGIPKVQNEVFLAAGKTYDVAIQAAPAGGTYPATGAGVAYAVFDRSLSLSTNNQRDGGMQAYVGVAGGTPSMLVPTLSASAKTYNCLAGTPVVVSDPSLGLLAGTVGANGVTQPAISTLLPITATLVLNSDGTFTYTPPATGLCSGTFGYLVNGTLALTATITECDATSSTSTCGLGGAPTANNDTYTGTVSTRLHIGSPGVLANDTDPSRLPLTAVLGAATGGTVTLNADGSFTATPTTPPVCTGTGTTRVCTSASMSFSYTAVNSQKTSSAAPGATVTVNFPAGSGIVVNLTDALDSTMKITDYRWTIEEDRTFYVDPACQINSTDPTLRPTTCPPLPVQSLGYSFHTANMPVIATGCTGPVSCEAGQTVLGSQDASHNTKNAIPVACDIGNGVCDQTKAQKDMSDPSQVALDPTKRYYISILPSDGINPSIAAVGTPVQVVPTCTPSSTVTCAMRPFVTSGGTNNMGDCTSFVAAPPPGNGDCGHNMGGAQISGQVVALGQNAVNIKLQRTPLPTAQIAVFVFEDDYPLNGENDPSGPPTASGPAPNEAGLAGFNIVLYDQAGGLGDNTGQPTYDMFNQPLSNSLAGTYDPMTGFNACPLTKKSDNIIGMIPTCPKYEDGADAAGQPLLSPLVGQAIIKNLYPGLYEVQASPAADRIAAGEEWLQTNTLDGGKPHEAFIKPNEPGYFQEFGPGGFHVSIGFANPKIINDRKSNSAGTGVCDPLPNGSGATCSADLYGQVQGTHMSRTPDQRTFASGDYSMYGFTQCYVGIGPPDAADIAFAKCDPNGNFQFVGIPPGDYKLTVFDQWNDIMLDGLVSPACIGSHNYVTPGTTTPAACALNIGASAANRLVVPVTQWRTNVYTSTFLDNNGNGLNDTGDTGLTLVSTNIRYRDGSFGFFNNTDLNGNAGWNEVFPFMNWLVVETTSTRYKQTGTHTVYDAGGPVDGTTGGGASNIAGGLGNTLERVSLPAALGVPGAVYCANADCTGQTIKNGGYYGGTATSGLAADGSTLVSTGRIDSPQPWGTTMGFQSLLGQSVWMDFGMRPFAHAGTNTTGVACTAPNTPIGCNPNFGQAIPAENGGIQGHVIYASTRPFDDPQLLLQLSWEPGVPRVVINLYQESTAPDGETALKLVDTTKTTSFDDWAQGFRRDANGALIQTSYTYTDATSNPKTVTGAVPNMNCPNQDPTSPFFQTLRGSSQWLDASNPKTKLAADSLFKCYDGWSQLNQVQPAPYDGKYTFPSVTVNPTTGRFTAANCTICTADPVDGSPMLPAGKYVVEVIVPNGFDLVKEEDKNILVGDIYIAPVTTQFAGFGNVFIMPDQAAVGASYNKNNPLNMTTDLGSTNALRHEGDTGSIEAFWPCVGAKRLVPDYNSLFPGVGQTAPFAGATRPLCDRKEVTLTDQSTVLAKFYVFTPTHIAGHFTGTMTNDFASEFDPFSPQFGEKFGPPNLPVGMRDFAGNEMGRVYADQWGIYNGLYFSSWEVNPPNPTGYAPQMAIACMNDAGPIPRTNALGQYLNAGGTIVTDVAQAAMITDPSYNPAYSNFCYEMPYMPGFTAYMDTPVIPTQAFADGYNLPDSEYPDQTPAIDSVVGNSGVAGPWVSAALQTITINCLGHDNASDPCSRVVQNPDFSGPGASTPPYNQKTIVRHYGFGSPGTVTIAGVPATCGTWTNAQLVCAVPVIPATFDPTTGVGSTCASTAAPGPGQTPRQISNPDANYRCGELVITNSTGKRSVDAVTITVAGKAPTVVTPASPSNNLFGSVLKNPLQTAIDNAIPGDLILITPGTYHEHLLMWKPVRLQGVGAAKVIINADAHPAGSLDQWRRQVNCLFGLTLSGVPISPDTHATIFDPDGNFTCPDGMFLHGDRIPFEPIVGWDAAGNGNLAQVLQEPTLMGAYEGAGVTVLARGVRIPANSNDFWGIQAAGLAGIAGAYPDGSRYLNGGTTSSDGTVGDCVVPTTGAAKERDYYTSNFKCNPSRIDGVAITNSSQGGGGIFMHGWAHYLEVANTRVYGNHGTLTGGINLGNGETPGAYALDGVTCTRNPGPVSPLCPPIPAGTLTNELIPLQINTFVRLHHNMIFNNAGIGDALFSGTPSGAGGVTISAGGDNYRLDHNWIAGNLSTGDGGGVEHSGQSYFGSIDHNFILYNQSTNPTLPTNGGGLGIIGANNPRTLNGQECGTATDADCPPGLGDGTGKALVIDSNLIIGNSAESGSGGGVRIQQVNGTELIALPQRPDRWYGIAMTNNIITNNVAGWDGGGVSMEDAFEVSVVNNTIASNDTTASAGVLFKTLAAINAASSPPGCTPTTDPTLPQNQNCLIPNAAHVPQPAGLVTMKNTPNMVDALNGLTIICPGGFGYTGFFGINGNCRALSIPQLTNDLIWQNRAFHVEITGPGAGLISQQQLVAMVPVLNQTSIGYCAASGVGANLVTAANTFYWDVGVRDDVVPNDGEGGARLSLQGSLLTPGVTYGTVTGGTANRYPSDSPVVAQFCNGSRVPPENGGHGFLSPPGASETTGLPKLFTFNNIQPAVTVDEGNNWINLTYGPLTLTSTSATGPAQAFSTAGTSMVAQAPAGPTLGAYSIGAASTAVNGGNSAAAPALDFFGNARARSTSNPADIGAVEFPASTTSLLVVTPTSLSFTGTVVGTTSATQTLTLANNGGGAPAAFTVVVATTAPANGLFARNGGTCGATLAAGANCTIVMQYTAAATANLTDTGTVTIAGALGSPVALTGSSAARTFTATVGPSPLAFGNWATSTTSNALNVRVLNTGNSPLVGLNFAFGGGSALFSRNGGNCGATLAVGASCTYGVQFAPGTTLGAITRTLTVTATGATITKTDTTTGVISLTGTGVATRAAVVISPNPLTITLPSTATGGFGSNFSGIGSVTLTNNAPLGTGASMTVGNVAVAGGTFITYNWSTTLAGPNTCTGATLAPQQSCAVGVRFTVLGSARGATPQLGTITFTDNGAASPQVGGLIGIASQAVVAFHDGTVDPTCVAATSVITTLNWAATATPRTACVVNAGNGDFIVSNTTLPAVAGAQFSRGTQTASACTLGRTVAPGQFCTVVISRARPAVAPTAGTGTLTATDTGAAAATQVLQLSGT